MRAKVVEEPNAAENAENAEDAAEPVEDAENAAKERVEKDKFLSLFLNKYTMNHI